MIKHGESLKTRYNLTINILYMHREISLPALCFNYDEFDLENDLAGYPIYDI